MDINMKLKNGFLKKITSYLSTKTVYDYYGDFQIPTHDIIFDFAVIDGSEVKARFVDINSDYGDFCYLVSFFYQKDFSEMTINEFVTSFAKYVHTDPTFVS